MKDVRIYEVGITAAPPNIEFSNDVCHGDIYVFVYFKPTTLRQRYMYT
jgi:hypothetical protein